MPEWTPLTWWLLAGAVVSSVLWMIVMMSDGEGDITDPTMDTRGPHDR